MYDDLITGLSHSYLETIAENFESILCIVGGWAVYLHATEGYENETGRLYLGSKDIDLGFHIDPHWTESEIQDSELLKVIGILKEKLYFEPFGSFRFAKSYDIQTQRELTKQERRTKESFNIHHLFVDLLVDNSNANLNSVLGFSPIDESLPRIISVTQKIGTLFR